ncbi:MAG: helix-turn-helix domain-containing protein [Gaiellaceae bacterium]
MVTTLRTAAPTAAPVAGPAARPRAGQHLGVRVRQLRAALALTQTDLAGDRVSKEYISQIERGKARPTPEMVQWLAERLGVDVHYLEQGTSSQEYGRHDAAISRAEAAVESAQYPEALEILADVKASPEATDLELRALMAESWARLYLGEVRPAIELLERARGLAEGDEFTDLERADVLFRLGCCRYKLSSISTAVALFAEALRLAQSCPLPSDRLRSDILQWRSRCYRRQRDWEAAREDIELALELADGLADNQTVAHAYFQASIVAERGGNWLRARSYAEQAKSLYESVSDRQNVGRLLNNLGGLNFLLGRPEQAIALLKDAFGVALEIGNDADAAQAVSSLAQVHLRSGELGLAEQQSRHALELLADRDDFLDEIGSAQVVLGRSLLEQGRLDEAEEIFGQADSTMAQLSSASHRALVWTAQGDLASRRGNDTAAAALYRRSAETLQDVRF